MPKFQQSFTVDATLEQVAEFHRDSSALKNLTPPLHLIRFHRLDPQEEGSITDFTIWLGFIPVRWTAQHREVDRLKGFTDVQVKGPFDSWRHRHEFSMKDGGITEVNDRVSAEFGTGWFRALLSRLIWYGLPILFSYRCMKTRQLLQSAERDKSTQAFGRF